MVAADVLRSTLARLLPDMDARTVTLSALMKALAQELQVAPGDLKAVKATVKGLVGEMLHLCSNDASPVKAAPACKSPDDDDDEAPKKAAPSKVKRVVVESDESEPERTVREPEPDNDSASESDSDAPQRKKKVTAKRRQVVASSDDDDAIPPKKPAAKGRRKPAASSEEDSPPSKKRKSVAKKASKPSSPKASKPKDAGWASDGLEQLKLLARTAGVLAPAIYKKIREAPSLQAAEDVVRDRLREAHVRWTGTYPGKHDIAAMKKKRDLARELDGMDTSLIIDDGPRRPRRARG
ncbi:hypothetical protein ACHHYP_02192, partial [Achlya hypogyna]